MKINFGLNKIKYDTFIDLGTSNTLIYQKESGLLVNEPSFVAIDKRAKNKFLAAGRRALSMSGRTPAHIEIKNPLSFGMVHDIALAQMLLKGLIEQVNKSFIKTFLHRRGIVISVPCDATRIEQNAFLEAARAIEAAEITLIQEPLAAALGAGIDIFSPKGKLVVDVGSGITEAVLISMGEPAYFKSFRKGGDDCTYEIIQLIKHKYDFIISNESAELLKQKASLFNKNLNNMFQVSGFSLRTKMPAVQKIYASDINEILLSFAKQTLNLIQETLENALPELVGDLHQTGVMLTGGGTLIEGFKDYLENKLSIPIYFSREPLQGVVYGNSKFTQYQDQLPSIRTQKVV